ncbi:hypothetical protein COOONC_26138 [Cooperia oncophora]
MVHAPIYVYPHKSALILEQYRSRIERRVKSGISFNRSLEVEQPTTVSTPDMNSRHNTSLSNGNSAIPLARLFNSSRSGEDSMTNVSQSHSHSHSQSSFTDPALDAGVGSPVGIRASHEGCTNYEEWIDGRVDGGPPGPVSLSRTLSRTTPGVQSFTAPSTPASSVSYKGGRSTFYQQRIGIGFGFLGRPTERRFFWKGAVIEE